MIRLEEPVRAAKNVPNDDREHHNSQPGNKHRNHSKSVELQLQILQLQILCTNSLS